MNFHEAAGAEGLKPEVQLDSIPPGAGGSLPSSVVAKGKVDFNEALIKVMDSPEVAALIERLLNGTEPWPRPRLYWEQQKFNPTNISVVLLRAAGFKGKEIAEMCGCGMANVSITLRHPYGQRLLMLLLPMVAAHSIDIKRRAELYAGTLLDKMYELAIESDDLTAIRGVTFGLMDRAGYGAVQKAEVNHTFSAPAASMDRLSKALEESRQVDEITADYTVVPRQLTEGSAAQDGTSADLVSDGLARNLSEPPGEDSPTQDQQERAA